MDKTNRSENNLKDSDERYFSEIYQKYYKNIFNMAIRLTGHLEVAEDIVHETFMKAYKHIKGFRGQSKIATWLYSIGKNECFQYLRSMEKKRFRDHELLIYEAEKTKNEPSCTEIEKQYLIDQVKDGCLTGLLQCLSIYQRSAFVLNILFNLSIKETAEIIGKSEGATKALLFRARKNLKGFLCKNCVLYDRNNHCKCINMISFSLNQGWIKKPSGKIMKKKMAIDTYSIEKEIKEYKSIVDIYRSLSKHDPKIQVDRSLEAFLEKQEKFFIIKKT